MNECIGCKNGLFNQEGHMLPGGCLYEPSDSDDFDERIEDYRYDRINKIENDRIKNKKSKKKSKYKIIIKLNK